MKRLTVLLFLFAVPLFAQVRTNDLVRPQTSTHTILIPAAGNVVGGGGTHFRSDINLINFANRTQTVQLQWLPQGSSGSGIAPVLLQINASSGLVSEDFVTAIMQQSGLGAVLIRGVGNDGTTPDTTAQLHATARIWTPYPGAQQGTMSQTFPAIVVPGLVSNRQWIFGLRRDDRFRLNVGIVNLSNSPQQFLIRTVGSIPPGQGEQLSQTVQALSMEQIGIPGQGVVGSFQVVVENVTPIATRSTAWQSYASSVDNTTGDAWSMSGFEAAGQQ
ncbi:MAG TPA: hypothetical protein VGF69_22240 [Thermoanaerobaculia bacterium]|jgi:hypothetical protein